MSPAVLREGPYRFYFVSHDGGEPPHIHVDRDDQSAKFWLDPVVLAYNLGFSPGELKRVASLAEEHQAALLEAWYGYFGTQVR